ncbi:MAG: hypothetical protein ABMA64_37020, partial [Myxococcota bacterium]
MSAPPQAPSHVPAVRRAVRAVIESNPELRDNAPLARKLAEPMAKVSLAAAELLDLERRMDEQLEGEPLATAAAANTGFDPRGVRAAAGTIRDQQRALNFPEFVTSLITGVFQAISTSNLQQLEAVSDLLQTVSAATDDFAADQVDEDRAAEWLTRRVRGLERGQDGQLQFREGAEPPSPQELGRMVGATARQADTIDPSDLSSLLPLARRSLARDRQSLLATMVLMGIQRIVVDAGRLTASMELEVAGRSEAEVSTAAQGSFGVGAWGASASVSATVGHVRDDRQFSRDELASRANLRSSVQVAFHTEPIPLDRMASSSRVRQIQTSALVPESELRRADGGAPLSAPATGPRTTESTFQPVPD